MANPLSDFWSGLSGADQYEDPTPSTIDTGLSTYTRAQAKPGPAQGVGDFVNQFLTGFINGRQGRGMNEDGSRMSTRDVLQQRLGLKQKEDAQKQADWQQTYNQKNRTAQEASELNRAKVLESQTNAGNVEKNRQFEQSVKAGDLFNKGTYQVAGQEAPEDIQVTRGGNTSNPEDIGQTSTVHVNPQFADTQGRPSIQAGGVTMIPRSPEEATQADIAKKGAESKAKMDEANAHLSALQNDSDPAVQEYIKNNPSLIGRLKVHNMFGFEPKEDDANTLAMMAANGNKSAEAALKILKPPKAGESDQDIKLRDPNLDPTQDDTSVLEGESNKVKSLANQLLNYAVQPGGFSLRDPDWKRAMALASQIRPGFSMQNYRVQQDVKRSFASGKDASNIQSFNTVVDHIADFDDKTKKLNNTNFHLGNTILNAAESEGPKGYPELRAAEKAANAVENELASTFKGGAPTDQETKQWRNTIQFNQTPKELHEGGAQEVTKLMLSRAAAAQKKWEDAMGTPVQSPIFNKHSADTIDKVMDEPGYTQKFMNSRSRFGDRNTAVDSKDSITGPIIPTKITQNPGIPPPPPPPPPPGMQTHLRMTGKDGKTYERLYHTKDDAELIRKAKAAGAQEVK